MNTSLTIKLQVEQADETDKSMVISTWTIKLQVEQIDEIDKSMVISTTPHEIPILSKPLSRSTEFFQKLNSSTRPLFQGLPLLLVAWRLLPKLWRSLQEFADHIKDSFL